MYIPLVASTRVHATGVFSHILREASASLLVLQRWAIPGPQQAERATRKALTLFIFYHIIANYLGSRYSYVVLLFIFLETCIMVNLDIHHDLKIFIVMRSKSINALYVTYGLRQQNCMQKFQYLIN